MQLLKSETLPLKTEADIVIARQTVRKWSQDSGFGLVELTKMVTAASELARNTIVYGLGGTISLEALNDGPKKGLRLIFEDQGPGILDLKLALTDGYTTGGGMGLGLSGAKRLVNEFDIITEPGKGTRVTIVRWK